MNANRKLEAMLMKFVEGFHLIKMVVIFGNGHSTDHKKTYYVCGYLKFFPLYIVKANLLSVLQMGLKISVALQIS